jgi:hypothetical protein
MTLIQRLLIDADEWEARGFCKIAAELRKRARNITTG